MNGPAKATYLQEQCARFGYTRDKVVAIGDGANDRYMLAEAGAAVGFQPHRILYGIINSVNNSGDHGIAKWLLDERSSAIKR